MKHQLEFELLDMDTTGLYENRYLIGLICHVHFRACSTADS